MGSGCAWVYSSVILQTLCDPEFLGRVVALEYTLSTLFEATSSYVAGTLSTERGLSNNELARMGAVLGLSLGFVWGIYYALSLGAAHPRFNTDYSPMKQPPTNHNSNGKKGVAPMEIELDRRDSSTSD